MPSAEYLMATYRAPQIESASMHHKMLRTLKEKSRRIADDTEDEVAETFCIRELTNHTDLRSGPIPKRKNKRVTHANVMRSRTNATVMAVVRISMAMTIQSFYRIAALPVARLTVRPLHGGKQ
jgi:hypothetical protein